MFPPEWRAGVAGHLILSDEDLTSVVQGLWKRLNTLQHYKVSASLPLTHTHTHQPCMCRIKLLKLFVKLVLTLVLLIVQGNFFPKCETM